MKRTKTWARIFLTAINFLLLLGLFGQLAIQWASLPARIPIHFNSVGQIDGWGSRVTLWGLPMVGATIWLTFGIVLRIPPKYWSMPCQIREENAERVYSFTRTMVAVFVLECLASFLVGQTFLIEAKPLPTWFIPAFFALLAATLAVSIVGIFRINREKPTETG